MRSNCILSILIIFCFFQATILRAQDIFTEVKVDASTANSSETRVFQDMESNIRQFFNENKWTEDELENFERIKTVFALNITQVIRAGQYSSSAQIQSLRPVYGSSYESIVLNVADRNIKFAYNESQPLIYTQNSVNDNLVSILAFYANLLIGMDYDTFSELGGTPYFNEALNIAQTAEQNNLGEGWGLNGGLNSRYSIIQSVLNGQLEVVRRAIYQYYRQGLDKMYAEPDAAREAILGSLEKIEEAYQLNPNAPFLILFMQSHADEITEIFSEGDLGIRRNAYEIMRKVAPSNAEKYEKMIQN